MSEARRGTRREFLRGVGSAVAGAGLGFALPAVFPGDAAAADTPADRIGIGFIGTGRQGMFLTRGFLKQIVAVCDVDQNHLSAAKGTVEKANGGTCATYTDYRKLLEDKNVGAVVIATPDHWHALQTIDACHAGKDVFVEKPLTHNIAEGRAMVTVARKTGRIVQTGSMQRSDRRFRLACELVRSGRLGKIHTVKVGIPAVNFTGPAVPDSTPPPELDYDFWLGPAPRRPYNVKHVHYLFKFFWDYGGGQMTNWGAHHLDITQWALGTDDSGPISAEGEARFQPDHWYETPEWSRVTFRYANGVTVLCGQDYRVGATFEGDKGTLFVTRGKITADPPEILTTPLTDTDVHLYESANHYRNWLECIRTRKLPISDVEIGHRSATIPHLGNISIRTGRAIIWDPVKEAIVGDADASKLLSRSYRAPWDLA